MHRKEIRRVAGRSLRYRRRSQWTDRIEEERVRLVPTLCVPASLLDYVHYVNLFLSESFYVFFSLSFSLSLSLSLFYLSL